MKLVGRVLVLVFVLFALVIAQVQASQAVWVTVGARAEDNGEWASGVKFIFSDSSDNYKGTCTTDASGYCSTGFNINNELGVKFTAYRAYPPLPYVQAGPVNVARDDNTYWCLFNPIGVWNHPVLGNFGTLQKNGYCAY